MIRFAKRAGIALTLAAGFAAGAFPAEPNAEARARAALALAEAEMSQSAVKPAVVTPLTYAEASAKALSENKKLVVWVATAHPFVEKELSDCVHCHVLGFFDETPPVTKPCVMVGVPFGGILQRKDLPSDCTADDVRAVKAVRVSPVKVPLESVLFPATSNCPNGLCPNQTQPFTQPFIQPSSSCPNGRCPNQKQQWVFPGR